MAKMGCAKCGGTMKKMAKGGPINKPMTYAKAQTGGNKLSSEFNIVGGMPQYTSGTDGKFGKMKKGGNVKAVKHSCPPGMVRSASGGCIAERKPGMAKGGAVKKKMATGGSTLKPVPTDKVGLSKLPTAVRNKMGYQKKGGTFKK